MGLSTSPAIRQSFINAFLISIPDTSKYLKFVDDLLLHSSKHGHLKYLEDLLKELLKCRKVLGTNPLLKPKLISQSPQIQRQTLPSQRSQTPG